MIINIDTSKKLDNNVVTKVVEWLSKNIKSLDNYNKQQIEALATDVDRSW